MPPTDNGFTDTLRAAVTRNPLTVTALETAVANKNTALIDGLLTELAARDPEGFDAITQHLISKGLERAAVQSAQSAAGQTQP